ncbi:MAG: FAD-binding protein [Dehalococcoidia bacterium]
MDAEKESGFHWDEEVDVIVVGFGGAGACAAIEAADKGCDVLVVERFNGGGATKNSGGICYAGGGTTFQKEAGVDDNPENMFNYLKMEVGDAVSDETLKRFCEQSPASISWLEDQGVRFDSSVCPFKTCYPPDPYYLYYSGNEPFPPYNRQATPAPRGHRPLGKGLPGNALFSRLKESAIEKGVKVRYRSKAKRLIADQNGSVAGLEFSSIPRYSLFNLLHRLLSYVVYKLRYVTISMPALNRVFSPLFSLLELRGRTVRVRARKGVILACGGYIFNRKMVEEIAPAYIKGPPLGTLGDDGSGIKLGEAVGGVAAHMDRISAWRFITPPEAMVKGVLVDQQGKRICNEQLYGAQMGEAMVGEHGGRAWLIIDADIWKRVRRDIGWGKARWFQVMSAFINLYLNRKKADSVDKLAEKCSIHRQNLRDTLESYNERARSGGADDMGKSSEHLQPIITPPLYAIDCSLDNRMFPCATLTLGGLVVDEETREVKRDDGSLIKGLYAVGRNAAGIPSRGYVSGLAIAHCVFSGREAARHAALKPD